MSYKWIALIVLAAALAGSQCFASPVTITNTENEDLVVYVIDQNAQGKPVVLPTSGTGCALVPAQSSTTLDATLDANGNYNLSWTAEQPLKSPLVKSSVCANNASQACQIDMRSAAAAPSHCQGS